MKCAGLNEERFEDINFALKFGKIRMDILRIEGIWSTSVIAPHAVQPSTYFHLILNLTVQLVDHILIKAERRRIIV